jgi:hypothetical protein
VTGRYCRNCGHELAETDRFCPNCGTTVPEAAHVPTPEADVDVPSPPPQAGVTTPPPDEAEGGRQDYLVARRPRWGQIGVAVLLAGTITTIPQALWQLATGNILTPLLVFGVLHPLTLLCGLWAALAWPGNHIKGLVALGSLAGLLDLAVNWSIWRLYSDLSSKWPDTISSNFSWSEVGGLDYLSIIAIAALFTAGGRFGELAESWRLPRGRDEESEGLRRIAREATGPRRELNETTLKLIQALGPSTLALIGLILGIFGS